MRSTYCVNRDWRLDNYAVEFSCYMKVKNYDDAQLSIEHLNKFGKIKSLLESCHDRYIATPKLSWFKKHLVKTSTILNIGCQHGSETIALLESFHPEHIIGINNNLEEIRECQNRVQNIRYFSTDIYPYYAPSSWDISSSWLINGEIPDFECLDISQPNCLQSYNNYFDVIYGRYILYIAERNGADLEHVAINLARLVKPKTGRIILVEPYMQDNESYNCMEPFLKNSSLICMEAIRGTEALGWDDSNRNNNQEEIDIFVTSDSEPSTVTVSSDDTVTEYPSGYVFKKQ